jgi:hypothetical protein
MVSFVLELLGWAGALAFVLAYYLVSCGRLQADRPLYHIINLGGALAVGSSVFFKQAWPAFALEVVWGTIAFVSLLRSFSRPPKDG